MRLKIEEIERCHKCKYYEQCQFIENCGYCHRYPPLEGKYPIVNASDWCGEYCFDEYEYAETL